MTTLSRNTFVETLRHSRVKPQDLEGITATEKTELTKADTNGDGVVKGAELNKLFTHMDRFDRDGRSSSVDTDRAPIARMTQSIAGAAGKPRTALRGRASGGTEHTGSGGGASGSSGAERTAGAGGIGRSASNAQKLAYAKRHARDLGLSITSTTGGKHAKHSFHYLGRAVDVAGSRAAMAQFYRDMAKLSPTELFHDPMGGMKRGRNVGAIGHHGNHVHVAF